MKNKRVAIYIRADEWKVIRVESVKAGKSLGEYLMGFWRVGKIRIKPDKLLEEGIEKAKVEKVEAVDEDAWRVNIRPILKKGV